MSKYLRIGALAVPMFFLLTLAAVAFADGNSGFASLEIGIGSRECALGDAGTAGAVGPQAMYWNPALNGWAESFGASFSYANWLQGSSQSAIFAIRPTPIGVVGFGATAFNAGQLEYRDDYPTDDPIGYFTPIDYSLYLSLTRALDSRVSLGVNGRYYYERIADYSARGFGTDVGLAFKPLDGMKLGFAVLDLGSSMAFIHEDFSLPLRTVAGISYTRLLGKSQVSASADAGYRVLQSGTAGECRNRVRAEQDAGVAGRIPVPGPERRPDRRTGSEDQGLPTRVFVRRARPGAGRDATIRAWTRVLRKRREPQITQVAQRENRRGPADRTGQAAGREKAGLRDTITDHRLWNTD